MHPCTRASSPSLALARKHVAMQLSPPHTRPSGDQQQSPLGSPLPPHTVSKAPRPNGANHYRFRRSSLIRLSLLRHPCLSHVICANGFRRHRGGSRCNSSSNGVVFSCRCTPISQAQDCLCKKLFLAAPLSEEGITWFPAVFFISNEKDPTHVGSLGTLKLTRFCRSGWRQTP